MTHPSAQTTATLAANGIARAGAVRAMEAASEAHVRAIAARAQLVAAGQQAREVLIRVQDPASITAGSLSPRTTSR